MRKIMTITKFASRFLGICGENLKLLTHEDIKYLFPDTKRSSFEYIRKNPQELECGRVILVTDGKQIIPYYSPIIDLDYQANNMECIKENKKGERCLDYTKMKIYELKKLLNVRFNGYHVSRCARHELESRGVVLTKKYNRNEFKKWRKDYERD